MTEQQKATNLCLEQQEELAASAKKIEATVKKNARSSMTISDWVCSRLRHTLNMDNEHRSSSKRELPYYKASKIAEDYLESFSRDAEATGTRAMVGQVKLWADSAFLDGDSYASDSAITGMILVVAAFHLQFGDGLTDNLKKRKPEEVKKAFDEIKTRVETKNLSLVARAMNKASISGDQVFLRQLIEDFGDSHVGQFGAQVEAGAVLGLGVIKELWPKLKPGANTKQKSTL